MAQYIPKEPLLAEIERTQKKLNLDDIGGRSVMAWSECFKKFLDTLEVKEVPIWEKVSPDTGQTTLYKDGGKSYLERFGYRIDLKDLDKLPKKELKAQKGE